MSSPPFGKRKAGAFRHAPDFVVVAVIETGGPPEYAIVVSGYAVLDRDTGEFRSKAFKFKGDALKRLAELLAELTGDIS